jgi:hypothetical protein
MTSRAEEDMRRQWAAVVLAGALVLGSGAALLSWRQLRAHQVQSVHIDQTHLMGIRDGMTEKEVAAVLGGPAGDYTTGPVEIDTLMSNAPVEWAYTREWTVDDGRIVVFFNKDGTVEAARLQIGWPRKPSLYRQLRAWLRR